MAGPRKIDKPLVLYGYGKLGKLAEEVFKKLEIPIAGIFDGATYLLKDLRVGESLKETGLLAICVATDLYQPISLSLSTAGWWDICSVYDIFEAYPECGITSGWFVGWMTKEDYIEEMNVVKKFSDILSRRHYNAFFAWHDDRLEIDVPINTEDRWFPPEIMPALHDNKRTYAEHSGSTLEDISIRRSLHPRFPDYLHPRFPNHYFSYIQLHLEGNELKAINENMDTFKQGRPIIAVTVYHTRDGLWKIEKVLMEGLDDYKWYFRLHAYQGQGAILYGVPEERKVV